MRALGLAAALGAFLAAPGGMAAIGPEQEKELKNPVADQAEAIKSGSALFRLSCAFCHGADAHGGSRGPDLASGRRTHGDSDATMFRTITKGVPGTEMPGNELREEEVWQLISYLRSLTVAPAAPAAGDREAGEKLFFGAATCSQCHMVNGRGGRLGPNLSRSGASRSTRHLAESIRNPGKEITQGFQTVSVATKDGKRITGVRKNEDTFTILLMDEKEQIHSFFKKDLKEVVHETRSLMPEYTESLLKETDLQNLLAYLESLRGNGK